MSKRLLFLGSDKISEICLKSLLDSFPNFNFEVITTSSTSLPAVLASSQGIPYYFESKGQMQNWKMMEPGHSLWKSRYDYLVSASFGYFIPEKLINHSENSLNMHPSLLPKYRGSSPIQHALYNRDSHTGVSIITLDPNKFDKGKILKQAQHPEVIDNETYASLSEKLANLGGKLLVEVIQNYDFYIKTGLIQDETKAIPANKLSLEFSKLNWEKTEEMYARFRCLLGTSLNPHLFFDGKRMNLLEMRKVTLIEWELLKTKYSAAVPGSLWLLYPGINKKKKTEKFFKTIDLVIYLKTGDGWIAIQDFVLAGRPHSKKAFIEFIQNYFDLEAYEKLENMSQSKGEDLIFD